MRNGPKSKITGILNDPTPFQSIPPQKKRQLPAAVTQSFENAKLSWTAFAFMEKSQSEVIPSK